MLVRCPGGVVVRFRSSLVLGTLDLQGPDLDHSVRDSTGRLRNEGNGVLEIICLDDHKACNRQRRTHERAVCSVHTLPVRIANVHGVPRTPNPSSSLSERFVVCMSPVANRGVRSVVARLIPVADSDEERHSRLPFSRSRSSANDARPARSASRSSGCTARQRA